MKKGHKFPGAGILCMFMLFAFVLPGAAPALSADFSEVEKILGISGQTQEGVTVFSFPRQDLKIKIKGDSVPTAIGFGSWTAWKEMAREYSRVGLVIGRAGVP